MKMLARGLEALMLASLATAPALALWVRERPGVAASCVAALAAALLVPRLLARRGLRLVRGLELVWLLPFSLAWGLGEGWALFERAGWWDDLTHLCSGGASFVLILAWGKSRGRLASGAALIVALSGALALGALWEVGEYAADQWLGSATQSGNSDTMADLICDLCGSLGTAGARHLARAIRRTQACARMASGS